MKERLERLASLVDGELSPEEARTLLSEVYRDPDLAEELSHQRVVKETLASIPAPLPDRQLTNSTLAIIRRQARERQRRAMLLRRTALALATSAAALVVGLLWVEGTNRPGTLGTSALSGGSDPAAQVLMGHENSARYLDLEEVERQGVRRPAGLPEVVISLHQVGKVTWQAELRGADPKELEVGVGPEPAPLPEEAQKGTTEEEETPEESDSVQRPEDGR